MQLKIKRNITFAMALSAVLSPLGAFAVDSQPEAPVLSLDECLSIALDENPTIRIADLEVKRMDYSKKEVIGQFLPSIDFGGSYSRTLAKQTMYMDFGALGGFGGGAGEGESGAEEAQSRASDKKASGMKVGLDNSYSVGFQASMPLIAPQLWKNLSISDTQIARALEQSRSSKLDLVNQVKSAYYAYMLAFASKEVMKESYDMARLTYETYSKQFAVGAASDYDVLRTSVAMKNIEPELLQADIAIKQARLQLQILMGVDASFEFRPAGALSDYEGSMTVPAAGVAEDLCSNPTLRLNTIDLELQRKALATQKLAYVPTLALTANYNWTSMNNGAPFKNLLWSPYSMIGLQLSVPIFSGGQRYSRVKQAQVQLTELELQRENLERSVNMQVTLAVDNIRINVEQIRSCVESVGQAERAHDIMTRSFDLGAASYLDLRDSELALTRARLAYYQAIYNYLVANSDLELLLGTANVATAQK
ncbi:MAG: TolC family protein [Muribaculaceae bacterium]|nr:TolC family protein [Muribaculaceae bacterium]